MAAILRRPAGGVIGESPDQCDTRNEMGRPTAGVLYVIVMVAVIVGLDVLVFRHHFWERLGANVGVVLVFVAFYFRFVRR
jgi:hypothetical protein